MATFQAFGTKPIVRKMLVRICAIFSFSSFMCLDIFYPSLVNMYIKNLMYAFHNHIPFASSLTYGPCLFLLIIFPFVHVWNICVISLIFTSQYIFLPLLLVIFFLKQCTFWIPPSYCNFKLSLYVIVPVFPFGFFCAICPASTMKI